MATQIDAVRAGSLVNRNVPGLKGSLNLTQKQMDLIRDVQEADNRQLENANSEAERFNLLLTKRHKLQKQILEAEHHSKKELAEHYKTIRASLNDQIHYVKESVKIERTAAKLRGDYAYEQERINTLTEYGHTVDVKRLSTLAEQAKVLDAHERLLLARNLAEREGLKTGNSFAKIQERITEEMEQQKETGTSFSKKYKEQMAEARKETSKFGFEIEGLSKTQSLAIHGATKAISFFGYKKAWDLSRQASLGFAEAAESVAEAQYRAGTSLERMDHGLWNYTKRAGAITLMNTDVGLSFIKMGLDAKDAEDIFPKMFAKNDMALRYYKDKNTDALTDMAKSAGAFSRQTGLSIDDALDMQADLMENKQMNAKTAASNMEGIGAAFRGMNDQLEDAGFKGSLLNVEKLARWTKEAADNTESASFNAETYAKSLGKMAANARKYGMSAKSADAAAKQWKTAENSEDPYAQLQRGRSLQEHLGTTYKDTIASGNLDNLISELKAKEGLASETAEQVASALIANSKGKGGPMYLNRLASMMEQTDANTAVFENIVMSYLEGKKVKATDAGGLNELNNDPILAQMLGMQAMDPQYRKVVQIAWHKYQAKHGVKGKYVDPVKDSKKTDDEAIAEAKKKQNAEATSNDTLSDPLKTINGAKTLFSNPLVLTGTAATTLVGTRIVGKAANDAAKKAIGGSLWQLLGNKARGLVGGASGALPSVATQTERALVPGFIDNAGRSMGTNVARTTGGGVAKTFLRNMGSGLFRGVRGKAGAILGLAALGTAGTTAYMASRNNQKTKDTGFQSDPNKTFEENKADEKAFLANQGVAPAPSQDQAVNTPTVPQAPGYTPTPGYDEGIALSRVVAGFAMEKLANPLLNKGLTAAAGKLGTSGVAGMAGKAAAKGAGLFAAKSASRAIPILGTLMSAGLTAAATDGPWGRKAMAALGDFGGTALGQVVTVGAGGGIVGGAAGAYGGEKLYDKLFGGAGNKDAVAQVANAQNAIQQQQAQATQQAMQNVTGAGPLGIAGIGNFGGMRPDGTVPLTVNISGLPRAVQQANSLNTSMITQYSGART